MKTTNTRKNVLALVETAMMVALAFGLEMLCMLLPQPWAFGGSISLGAIPIFYLSYRRGWKWGIAAGFVYSCIQMITGLYLPAAGDLLSVVLCILLDYVIAFSALGLADVFASPFEKSSKTSVRIAGYVIGAVGASFLRFICSFISGIVLWNSYAAEYDLHPWIYSLAYNGSYMLGNAFIAAAALTWLCLAIDPKTLRPMK